VKFLSRARWLVPLWAVTAAALAVSVYAGLWLNALVLLVIGWLSVYGEAQHQRATDAEQLAANAAAERDAMSSLAAKLGKRLVDADLRYYARNPRADWEG